MALAQVRSGLNSSEAAYASRLHRWQDDAIEKIAQSIEKDDGVELLSGKVKLEVDALKNDLVNRRQQIANFGRGQLARELKRQQRRS